MARKPIYKWNPLYTKTTVRVALQNVFLSSSFTGELGPDHKKLIGEILAECDKKAIEQRELRNE